MASHQDDAVLPGEDLSSSSQDEDEEDVADDDEDDDEELENDDDRVHSASPSTSSAVVSAATSVVGANTVTVALPAVPKGEPPAIISTTVIADLSGSDRRLNDGALVAQAPEEKKPALDDSRKLFQRLWTDEDEIELLQGFLDYTAQRGKTTHHGQNDTALFYDQIKSKLQLDFNKNQLVEKLRRLKKKYRNVLSKISSGKEFSFKSAHDQATFEISRKIWSDIGRIGGAEDNTLEDDDSNPNTSNANFNIIEVKGEDAGGFSIEKKTPPRSRKRSRSKSDPRTEERRCFSDAPAAATIKDNCNNNNNNNNNGSGNNHNNGNVQGLIEETVRSCLSPLLKELLSNAMGGPCTAAATATARGFGGLALNPMPLSFGIQPLNLGIMEVADERWRKQQILELEVYSKRLELVQDQIKEALDELRSKGGSLM